MTKKQIASLVGAAGLVAGALGYNAPAFTGNDDVHKQMLYVLRLVCINTAPDDEAKRECAR